FKPEQAPAPTADFPTADTANAASTSRTAPAPQSPEADEKPVGTTSRLLEAKRRAQKRRDG
ncbi:MAG: hypothetical protein U1F83_12230, partial [Verrucomicrobiota bacterium]